MTREYGAACRAVPACLPPNQVACCAVAGPEARVNVVPPESSCHPVSPYCHPERSRRVWVRGGQGVTASRA